MRPLRSLIRLIRAVRNWPRVVLDHPRLLASDYVCRLRDGALVAMRGGTDDRHVLFEVFVHRVYPLSLQPGDVAIDIGAHIGCFTLMAARQGARVLSYEPWPENFRRLERNVALNQVTTSSLFPVAVAGRRGPATLHVPSDRHLTARAALHERRPSRALPAECVTLDDVVSVNGLDRVDLLKIDCEGGEYEIVYGASDATLGRIKRLMIECEVFGAAFGEAGAAPKDWGIGSLAAFLQARGFDATTEGKMLFAARPGA